MLSRVRDRDTEAITRLDFDDPVIAAYMARVDEELRRGRGLVPLTGCTPERFNEDDLTRIYWGLGTYLGEAESQSVLGDRIGHVRRSLENPNDRGYRSDRELRMHNDGTDIAGCSV